MRSTRNTILIVLSVLLLVGMSTVTLAQDEPIQLLWWDTYAEPDAAKAAVVQEVIAEYEAQHPNVTIVREVNDFQTMQTLINTALASGTGPDMLLYGTGAGFMGPLVDGNLLLPLDEYVDQYHWRDRIYPWTWDSATFNDHVYAIGNELEMIGIYYNKDLFTELGIEIPKSYDELLNLCAVAQSAGYIPIAFADKAGWPAYHMFSSFANVLAGKEGMDAVFAGDAAWTDPPFVEAIQKAFVDMNQAGCYPPSPNALDYPEGNELFYSGQALMDHTGMWLYTDILANSDFEVGFFALPPIGDHPSLPPGGLGSGVMISAATEHPDEAAAFLDLYFSEEFARTWIEDANAIPPVNVDISQFDLEPLYASFAQTIHDASTGSGGLGYNIDVLTPPEFNTEMNQGFQAVINGERTPEEQAQVLQDTYQAYLNR
ncbi:MAG: extracellular solute-binding protein [Anaerolineae bacterium]|nr:extracellular solute-binding protein [Anaerolineae bacterium]